MIRTTSHLAAFGANRRGMRKDFVVAHDDAGTRLHHIQAYAETMGIMVTYPTFRRAHAHADQTPLGA
jgi:hypothetical protein